MVLRLDGDGNTAWMQQFGTAGSDSVLSVCTDPLGVFVGGRTDGALTGSSFGSVDGFLARYNIFGQRQWVRQLGTAGADLVTSVAVDGTNVIVAGMMAGSAPGDYQAFLAKYNGQGTQLWLRTLGGADRDEGHEIAVVGNRYVLAGTTYGSVAGPSFGGSDGFLAWFDTAGTEIYVRQFGSSGSDQALALASDGSTGVYVAGLTSGLLGSTHFGTVDFFVGRYDQTGNHGPFLQFGSSATEIMTGLDVDGSGGVYFGGGTHGNLAGTSAGQEDIVLGRFSGRLCEADCDNDGVLTLSDFGCFQTKFALGCP